MILSNKIDNLMSLVYQKNFYGELIKTSNFNKEDLLSNFEKGDDGKYRVIYITRNLINDKIYIGQHTTLNIDDGYLGSGNLIKQAVKKYGKKNFKVRFCCFCKNQEQLDDQEKFWIQYFDSIDNGYNLSEGGYSVIGEIGRQKSIENRRRKLKSGEIVVWNKGTKGLYSEEHRKHLSNIAKSRKHSFESNKKRSIKLKGRIVSQKTKEKSKQTKINNGTYRKPMSKVQKDYLRKINTGKKQSLETINKRINKITGKKRSDEQRNNLRSGAERNMKKVIQKDFNGNFFRLWDNMNRLMESHPEYRRGSIIGAINGNIRYKGYVWEYEK